MNVMSLDIELNQLDGKPKTIEIGAAVFKARTGELIETFQTYVNPGELITPFITELTRITDEDVKNAPNILEAYRMLEDFHKKHKCFKNPIVWGSGVRNDSSTIHQESRVEDHNFMGFRVIDAKTLYQSLQMYRNSTIKGGLVTACEKLGIGFDKTYGSAHGALPDALNTFKVWFHLVDRLDRGFRV